MISARPTPTTPVPLNFGLMVPNFSYVLDFAQTKRILLRIHLT